MDASQMAPAASTVPITARATPVDARAHSPAVLRSHGAVAAEAAATAPPATRGMPNPHPTEQRLQKHRRDAYASAVWGERER